MTSEDRPKRILAIDFGDRKTGVASTDWTGTIRIPLETIFAGDDETCARQISSLVRERDTQLLVAGLPLSLDGNEGPRAKRTRAFLEVLKRHVKVPIETVDESHTTDEAHARLKSMGIKAARRHKIEDSMAALIILERFLANQPIDQPEPPEPEF
ncbi:MAG: Holliday junction resolvase RuvX [Planctomycetota bacterium]